MPTRRSRRSLKTIVQRYLTYPFEGEQIKLPMVTVRLRGSSGKSVKTLALVDSGATATFVPPELADIVSLRLGESSDAIGAGGKFDTRLSDTTLELLKAGSVMTEMKSEVHVPADRERVPYVVLGRDTVFQHYDITFRENKQQTILRKPKR